MNEINIGSRTLLVHGSVYALASVSPIVVAFVITPLLTSLLTQDNYGEVAIGLSVAQLGQILVAMGLPTAITRHVALEESGAKGAALSVLAAVVFGLCVAIVFAVVLVTFRPALGWEKMPVVGVLAATVSAWLLGVFMCIQSLVRGLSLPGRFVTQSILVALCPPSVGVLFLLLSGRDSVRYLVILAAIQFVLICTFVTRLTWQLRPQLSWADLRKSFAIGLPTVPHQIAMVAAIQLWVLVAGLLFGTESAGETQIAFLIGGAPLLFLGALNNSWSIQVYSNNEKNRVAFVEETARLMTVVALILSVGVQVLAHPVLALITHSTYPSMAMVGLTTIATMAAPIAVIYLANMHFIVASGRTGPMSWTSPTALVLALASSVAVRVIQPTWGITCLGVGLVIFYILLSLSAIILRRRAGIPTLKMRQSVMAVFGGIGTGFVSFQMVWPSVWVRLAVAVAVGVIGLFVCARFVREPIRAR